MCQYCGGTGLCYLLYSAVGLKIYNIIRKVLFSKKVKKGGMVLEKNEGDKTKCRKEER